MSVDYEVGRGKLAGCFLQAFGSLSVKFAQKETLWHQSGAWSLAKT